VRVDNRLHAVEITSEQRPQRLRIRRLTQRRRPGHIAEQDGHGLALLSTLAGERDSAVRAERKPAGEFLAARGTSRHRASLRRA